MRNDLHVKGEVIVGRDHCFHDDMRLLRLGSGWGEADALAHTVDVRIDWERRTVEAEANHDGSGF
jgi:hypothetical protein